MKEYKIFILISILDILVIGCNTSGNHSKEVSNDSNAIISKAPKNSMKTNAYSNLSCDSLLTLLIKSSNIDSILKKYNVNAKEFDNGILTINITNTNELGHNTPIAWLKLDTTTLQLSDVTINPNHPKILYYDTILCRILLKKCLR